MDARAPAVPVFVFQDAKSGQSRGVNALHVLTFVPHGKGTLLTFVNGDTVTLADSFEAVADTLRDDRMDG